MPARRYRRIVCLREQLRSCYNIAAVADNPVHIDEIKYTFSSVGFRFENIACHPPVKQNDIIIVITAVIITKQPTVNMRRRVGTPTD